MTSNNILLATTPYATPHGTLPFPLITPAHIEEAILKGIEMEDAEIAAIVDNPAAPTHENTVLALERSGAILERATTVMHNLLSAETNDDLEAVAERVTPLLAAHSANITLNAPLYKRIKTVYAEATAHPEAYSAEDMMLIETTHETFTRCGVNLPEDKQQRLREIKATLSQLALQFSQNNIRETNDFQMHLTDEADLAGLPESQRVAAAAAAREKGLDGWVFTLHAPSYGPFMQYSERRDLRRTMFIASGTRCTRPGDRNNFEICQQMVNLRIELAQLLGYATYADFVLKKRMAQTIGHVSGLLDGLIDRYMPAARQEVAEVEAYAREVEGDPDFVLEQWDYSHYAHLLKLSAYNVDAEMLRPYLPLDRVITGVFGLATRLYGINFTPNADIPLYHPDVTAYDVTDADGTFLAVLYADFFPRAGKQSGAWMTSYREQYKETVKTDDGVEQSTDHRPHVSVTMNFTPPVPATDEAPARPSLLTLGEVTTFLHEFGHALHGIFASSHYASLSGTNVYWDFVELPSQFMENYAFETEFLHTFAFHYETGEAIPDELIERVRRARNFQVAYACMRQVSFGLLDMAYYTRTEPLQNADLRSFEAEAWERVQLLPKCPDTCMTTQFGHIMSGGYSAGYYSYKWAEVLDADAFEAFVERGMFSREVAEDFRRKVLEPGGTVHPATLYRNFRGRDASIDALLRRDGILSAHC